MLADALLYVSEERIRDILGSLYLVLFVILCVVMKIHSKKNPNSPQEMPKPLGSYWLFTFFSCAYVLEIAFYEAVFLLDLFPGSAVFGWAAIFIAMAYIVGFFCSLCRLMTAQPGALQLIRIFLFSFAPFVFIFPLLLFIICALWFGHEQSFFIYKKHLDPFTSFYSSCLLSIPWLLYFTFSSKMKQYCPT